MRFAAFRSGDREGLAAAGADGIFHGLLNGEEGYPGSLAFLLMHGREALDSAATALSKGPQIDLSQAVLLPPLQAPGKIICVGLNYIDHSIESGLPCPTIRQSSRVLLPASSGAVPRSSVQKLLYSLIMKENWLNHRRWRKHISERDALGHVVGYSIFNDASIRDYQKKSPQWTIGKNFDGTGAFGPCMVPADELPARSEGVAYPDTPEWSGGAGCLNGRYGVQRGAPNFNPERGHDDFTRRHHRDRHSGRVGMARNPPLFMKHGDVCEVEIEGIGILRNKVEDE